MQPFTLTARAMRGRHGLRGFGPVGILAISPSWPATRRRAAERRPVLPWAWCSRTPWREIGYVGPASWILTLAVGIVFGVAFKLLMKAFVMPLLGAPRINQAYHYLVGNAVRASRTRSTR